MPYDPIHEENGKWYFWDETQADRVGPFSTEEQARTALKEYCEFLDSGPPCKMTGMFGE